MQKYNVKIFRAGYKKVKSATDIIYGTKNDNLGPSSLLKFYPFPTKLKKATQG